MLCPSTRSLPASSSFQFYLDRPQSLFYSYLTAKLDWLVLPRSVLPSKVSNVIVNSNNNRNNNNNNDFQATFGSVNTNTQSAEATQMGSTMTMITVTPVGVPVVVPVGR